MNEFNKGASAMLGLIVCLALLAVVIWLSTHPTTALRVFP